jgi:hypothetical protein
MPTPLKKHYNTNFTHFEALALARDDSRRDVLKCTRSEEIELNAIFTCKSYKGVVRTIDGELVAASRLFGEVFLEFILLLAKLISVRRRLFL